VDDGAFTFSVFEVGEHEPKAIGSLPHTFAAPTPTLASFQADMSALVTAETALLARTEAAVETRNAKLASLPVFSQGSREAAAARGVERERPVEWRARRGKRVAPRGEHVARRSVRVARAGESRAARLSFGGLPGTRGGRL
jgi:hypothetical protein